MTPATALLAYVSISITGVLLELILSKLYYKLTGKSYKKNHFSFLSYIMFLFFPAFAFFFVAHSLGYSVIKVFIILGAAGTILEWLLGFSYHKIVGQRLWTYHRYTIGGYSSLLSFPLWGFLGLLLWLLAKSI